MKGGYDGREDDWTCESMGYGDFKNLAMAHMDELFAFAVGLCASRVDAEDLVHSTYLRAFERWHQLAHGDRCRAWLFQVLRNIFINDVRRERRAPFLHLVEEPPEGSTTTSSPSESGRPEVQVDNFVERFLATDMRAALCRLPAVSQELVLLADVWGFDYQEIATITDQPVGTIRSRLHRVRCRLAIELRDYAEERGFVGRRSNLSKLDAERSES